MKNKRIVFKILYSIIAVTIVFTLALFVKVDAKEVVNNNIAVVNETTDELNYYTSYRKYYEAENKDGNDVKFSTVVKYVERLYQEGVSRFESSTFKPLDSVPEPPYATYFKDFYLYWYDSSEFLLRTKENINESRPNEIKNIYDDILNYININNIGSAKTKINELITELNKDAAILDSKNIYALKIEITTKEDSNVDLDAAYYLTYNSFAKAFKQKNKDKKITYTEVAKQIGNLLDEGINRIKTENSDYYICFSNSYGSWYETSGFEKKVMAYISGSRVTSVELQFAAVKSTAKTLDVDATTQEVAKLKEMLLTDAKALDNLLGYNSKDGSNTGLTIATFFGCFTIIIREGLEAILILGAIIAYLIKSGNKKQTKFVYIGAIVAVVASIGLAALLYGISLNGISTAIPQEIIEGVTALIAVAVLIYVTNWMISKAESDAWTNYISNKVSVSADKGKIFTLAFTSFLAVFREGAEVILFYQPLVVSASEMNMGWLAVLGGLVLGLLVVLAVFLIIRIFGIKIPLKPFFMITSILMAAMSVIFLGSGIWELFIDGGLLGSWGWPSGIIQPLAWMSENDVLNFFGIYPTWWTIIPQIILTIITVFTFVFWLKYGTKKKNENEESKENEEIVPQEENGINASDSVNIDLQNETDDNRVTSSENEEKSK
ncbi:MAG: FTR1 family iron permease [Acholeplasmatales bacterium]|nr:FTR1 family iron permease [Acholeplasmatales bacterium]